MTLKVKMVPHVVSMRDGHSGIARVIEAYFKHLPQFGIELVDKHATSYDLSAVHAGATAENCDVCHCHGLYWTADYNASDWEYRANAKVIAAIRHAKTVTVPSRWVAETFQRDMHYTPHVVPHGIDWKEWQTNTKREGYILYNKNRQGDVCDAAPIVHLAQQFNQESFITTFTTQNLPNIKQLGAMPHHRMKDLVQKAGVYIATTKETFGIGILEAMASGVPVLGYRHGAIVDIVKHGVNGYLAQPGNIEDLAAGLQYCLEHNQALGENGRQLAQTWTWERACEQVATIYNDVLNPQPSTAAIIIPVYNYAHLVGRAIESATQQTYEQLTDIIVVDDGSSDNPKEVVKKWARRDSRVKYIHQENAGVAIARNTGISHTTAKYITCLDADDALRPIFLSTLIPHLEKDESLGIAYSGLSLVKKGKVLSKGRWPNQSNFDLQATGHNQVPTCCVFRREAWQRLGGYRQRYAPKGCGTEDANFWLRIGGIGYDARKVTDKPLFLYTLGGGTSKQGYHEVNWLEWIPWTKDKEYPFAAPATPENHSHPVRSYDEPVVSIVIPVAEWHIDQVVEALDSVEAQTFRKWEVIVVCDGFEARAAFKAAFPFARVVSTPNTEQKGAGAARNLGASLARADLLLFLDADDWLLPEAVELLLREYTEDGIIYSESLAIRTLSENEAATFKRNQELLDYDIDTGVATLLQRVAEYDYSLAIQQPSSTPYFWCYVTSLVPKVWHNEIGGFDESLESWEDWDYWIRMAKAGKPFKALHKPTMVYNYHGGSRREYGKTIKDELLQGLKEKHKEVKIVACRSCGGRRVITRAPVKPLVMESEDNLMHNDNFVMIQYVSPSRGSRGIIGTHVFPQRIVPKMRSTRGGWVMDYGYHSPGDTFLVHINDQKLQPQMFIPLSRPEAILAPRKTVAAPPPAPLQQLLRQPTAPPPTASKPEEPATFDFQQLPGISPAISKALVEFGYETKEDLINAGESELKKVPGIGPAKAAMIIDQLTAKLDKDEILQQLEQALMGDNA